MAHCSRGWETPGVKETRPWIPQGAEKFTIRTRRRRTKSTVLRRSQNSCAMRFCSTGIYDDLEVDYSPYGPYSALLYCDFMVGVGRFVRFGSVFWVSLIWFLICFLVFWTINNLIFLKKFLFNIFEITKSYNTSCLMRPRRKLRS